MTTSKWLLGLLLVVCYAAPARAVLYSQDFDVDSTASWTLNGGPSDEAANYFFDYGTAAGIPSAPNSSGGTTRGMKLQANQSSGVFGGMSVSPTGQSFSGEYTLRFDWWANYNGPLGPSPVGGNGSTQLSTFGVGTNGTTVQWPGGTQNSVWFAATGDGQSSSDWRAYSSAAGTSYPDASSVYAAGAVTGNRNNTHAYYAGFGSNTAPAAQLTLYPQQTGTTVVGSAGMEWHDVKIFKGASFVKWVVDNVPIATIDLATVTLSGGNIFLGHSDFNATSSSDVNDVNLLFTLIDNVSVTTGVPEPGAWLFGLAATMGAGLVSIVRRRRKAA